MSIKNYRGVSGISTFNGKAFIELVKMYGNKKTGGGAIEVGYFPVDWSDKSTVCFDCKHLNGACYVDERGIAAQHRSFTNGKNYVADVKLRHFKNRFVRVGQWGDPAVVGFERVKKIAGIAVGVVGYTHQWLTCDQRLKGLLQASVDTVDEMLEANRMGWKTFRVKLPEDPVYFGELVCPNQLDKDVQCISCGICDGQKANVVIDVHGLTHKQNKYRKFKLEVVA